MMIVQLDPKQKVIWKYPLHAADSASILMPEGARILTVQTQDGQPQIWALVDQAAKPVPHYFRIVATGQPFTLPEVCAYIGTFQMHGGALVFHVFMVGEPVAC